ncbi:MAG: DUF2520 domain-containing protein [Putridiphycobacter sp.]|nr:DUF2520 domain-containing protein [Putridiphycobacter sp.]
MINTVSIIGAGNVATVLGKTLFNNGIKIVNICSRSLNRTEELAVICRAKAITRIDELDSDIDLLIVAVKDDAIQDVVSQVKMSVPIVHTSGSVGISVFRNVENHGILYPFQTFSSNRTIEISEVPFFIEASTNEFEVILNEFVRVTMSKNVYNFDSASRAKIHLAGVLSNNFTTQLIIEAAYILDSINVPFTILKPLIEETVKKIFDEGPEKALTGPAKRGDNMIIKKQLASIENKKLQEIYRLMSELIMESNVF